MGSGGCKGVAVELLSNCCHFDAFFCYLGSTSALSVAAKGCTILALQRGEASQGLESPHFLGQIRANSTSCGKSQNHLF